MKYSQSDPRGIAVGLDDEVDESSGGSPKESPASKSQMKKGEERVTTSIMKVVHRSMARNNNLWEIIGL